MILILHINLIYLMVKYSNMDSDHILIWLMASRYHFGKWAS